MSVVVETVRVGVIGVGRRGSEHVRRLQRMRQELGLEVSAVCDIIPERAQRAAEETGARAFTSYREMLDSVPLDAVYVATPAPVHAECAVAVVQAGRTQTGRAQAGRTLAGGAPAGGAPAGGAQAERAQADGAGPVALYCEKPLAWTIEQAKQIVNAVDQAGAVAAVGYQWRYGSVVDTALQLLRGAPVALVRMQYYWTVPLVETIRNAAVGGGQIFDQATHLIDLARLFAGDPVHVYAKYTLNARQRQDFDGHANWDGYAVTMDFDSGAVGTISTSYALFPTIPETPTVDVVAKDLLLRLTLHRLEVFRRTPTAASVSAPGAGAVGAGAVGAALVGAGAVGGAGSVGAALPGGHALPYQHEVYQNKADVDEEATRRFIEAVRRHQPGLVRSTPADGLKSLAATIACNQSAVLGKEVKLAEVLERGGAAV